MNAFKSKYKKIAALKVRENKKNTESKYIWREVGVLFSTPHASSMFIKLHATAFSEARTIQVFMDADKKLAISDVDESASDASNAENGSTSYTNQNASNEPVEAFNEENMGDELLKNPFDF